MVGRSEKLIECEYSWFSAKPILVGRYKLVGVERRHHLNGGERFKYDESHCGACSSQACCVRWYAERETAQTS